MKLAYAGIAVTNLEEAIALWEGLGFKLKQQFEKQAPKARAASLKDENGGGIELWQFDDNDEGLAKIVGRHIAFICEDARHDAEKLKAKGFREVIPFTEGVTLDYLFLEDDNGTYYELAQEKVHS